MPTFEIQTPDGKSFHVEAPDIHSANDTINQFISAQQVHPANGGFGTRDQREPDTITTDSGTTVPTIPYAEGLADRAIQMHNAGSVDQGGAGAVDTGMALSVPGLNKVAAGVMSATGALPANYSADNQQPYNYDQSKGFIQGRTDYDEATHPNYQMGGKVGGTLLQAALLPQTAVAKLGTVGNMALTGGLYTAGSSAIENDGTLGDKLVAAGKGFGIGTATGGVLGTAAAGAGKLLSAGQKLFAPTAGVGQKAAQAGEDLVNQGILQRNIPAAVASDALGTQRAAQMVSGSPFGGPLRTATTEGVQDVGQGVRNVAGNIGTPAEADVAGGNIATGLNDHINVRTKAEVKQAYDTARAPVDPAVQTNLPDTTSAAQDVLNRRGAANIDGNGAAVDHVMAAITNPKGLTVQGIQDLRTTLREWQKNPLSRPPTFKASEVDAIYNGLTNDLGRAYEIAGGPQARAGWEAANALKAETAARNQFLTQKLLGPGKSDEQRFNALVNAAKEKTGDTKLLMQARQAMTPQEWNDFSSSALHHMGRGPDDTFSTDRFLNEYGKMSEAGKNILFSGDHRAAIEKLADVSRGYKEYGKLANFSNTANNASVAGLAAGLVTAPFKTIAAALGANGAARLLARPASAAGMARWSHAYARFQQSANAATARTLSTATKAFSLLIAQQMGASPKEIEQRLLDGPAVQPRKF